MSQPLDTESYGNRRVEDNAPDIGADEVGLMIMAGSHANDSISHNLAASTLFPSAPNSGTSLRRFFVKPQSGITLSLSAINGTYLPATSTNGWNLPPGVLAPGVVDPIPIGCPGVSGGVFIWINTQNRPSSPTSPGGWDPPSGDLPDLQQDFWPSPLWLGAASHYQWDFLRTQKSDAEAATEGFFNLQAKLLTGVGCWAWTNLQSEYR
jgi:hypothetical protein